MQHQFILGFMQVDNRVKKIKEFLEDKKSFLDHMNEVDFDWNVLGIMEGLDEVSTASLESKLNEIAKILLHSNIVLDKRLDSLMIPIVCRAFKVYGHLINDCLAAINYVNSKIHALPETWEYNSIDIEAEFCNLMAEEIAHLKL